ncbi:hypothetical protein EZV62_004437 [Acer yangbiense]|uniref:Uncharacterized protein n=1 Tax=Acer yangbiense TaxID=1000413 RepID=A0A5C7ILK4_9ROSI|nr:hypothetical protein EZV62_004437 [Acer yangbiense]
MDNLEMIWHNQLEDSQNVQNYQKLCKVSLKDIYVEECGIKEIVAKEEAGDRTFVFSELTSLSLHNLPDLKCFYPVDPLAPNIDSASIAPQLFAASLFPYLGFLYFITKSKSAPNLTLFGFYFLLAFVGATSEWLTRVRFVTQPVGHDAKHARGGTIGYTNRRSPVRERNSAALHGIETAHQETIAFPHMDSTPTTQKDTNADVPDVGSWMVVSPDAPQVPATAVVISDTTLMSQKASSSGDLADPSLQIDQSLQELKRKEDRVSSDSLEFDLLNDVIFFGV